MFKPCIGLRSIKHLNEPPEKVINTYQTHIFGWWSRNPKDDSREINPLLSANPGSRRPLSLLLHLVLSATVGLLPSSSLCRWGVASRSGVHKFFQVAGLLYLEYGLVLLQILVCWGFSGLLVRFPNKFWNSEIWLQEHWSVLIWVMPFRRDCKTLPILPHWPGVSASSTVECMLYPPGFSLIVMPNFESSQVPT